MIIPDTRERNAFNKDWICDKIKPENYSRSTPGVSDEQNGVTDLCDCGWGPAKQTYSAQYPSVTATFINKTIKNGMRASTPCTGGTQAQNYIPVLAAPPNCACGNTPPPPPPHTCDHNTKDDLWDLQFCRWWGWNWVKKREELLNRQRNVTEKASTKKCDPACNATGCSPPNKCGKPCRRRKRFVSWCNKFLKRHRRKKRVLQEDEKERLQRLYDTPCSSVQLNTCPCPVSDWECRSINLKGEYECYCTSTRQGSRSTVVVCNQTRRKSCKNHSRKHQSWIPEHTDSSSSDECCPRKACRSSTEESVEYVSLRMECVKSDSDSNSSCNCRSNQKACCGKGAPERCCEKRNPKRCSEKQNLKHRCGEQSPKRCCEEKQKTRIPCSLRTQPMVIPCDNLDMYTKCPPPRIPRFRRRAPLCALVEDACCRRPPKRNVCCSCSDCCGRKRKSSCRCKCKNCCASRQPYKKMKTNDKHKKIYLRCCCCCCCCQSDKSNGNGDDKGKLDKSCGISFLSIQNGLTGKQKLGIFNPFPHGGLLNPQFVSNAINSGLYSSPVSGRTYTLQSPGIIQPEFTAPQAVPSPQPLNVNDPTPFVNIAPAQTSYVDDEHTSLLNAVCEAILSSRCTVREPQCMKQDFESQSSSELAVHGYESSTTQTDCFKNVQHSKLKRSQVREKQNSNFCQTEPILSSIQEEKLPKRSNFQSEVSKLAFENVTTSSGVLEDSPNWENQITSLTTRPLVKKQFCNKFFMADPFVLGRPIAFNINHSLRNPFVMGQVPQNPIAREASSPFVSEETDTAGLVSTNEVDTFTKMVVSENDPQKALGFSCSELPTGLDLVGVKRPTSGLMEVLGPSSGLMEGSGLSPGWVETPRLTSRWMEAPGLSSRWMETSEISSNLVEAPGINPDLIEARAPSSNLMEVPGLKSNLMEVPGLKSNLMEVSGLKSNSMEAPRSNLNLMKMPRQNLNLIEPPGPSSNLIKVPASRSDFMGISGLSSSLVSAPGLTLNLKKVPGSIQNLEMAPQSRSVLEPEANPRMMMIPKLCSSSTEVSKLSPNFIESSILSQNLMGASNLSQNLMGPSNLSRNFIEAPNLSQNFIETPNLSSNFTKAPDPIPNYTEIPKLNLYSIEIPNPSTSKVLRDTSTSPFQFEYTKVRKRDSRSDYIYPHKVPKRESSFSMFCGPVPRHQDSYPPNNNSSGYQTEPLPTEMLISHPKRRLATTKPNFILKRKGKNYKRSL